MISGGAQQGFTLTATSGTWTNNPTSYAYQWRRCTGTNTNSCTSITGATSTTYLQVAADVGNRIRVNVTATNVSGSTTATSAATAVVAAAVAPSNTSPPIIGGTRQVGQTLTASSGTWTGAPSPTFTYQWRRCDGSGFGCADVAGATSYSYTLTTSDLGSTLKAAVTGTNVAGSAIANSAPTSPITDIPPANTAPPTITGTAEQGQTLTSSTGTWSGGSATYSYQWRNCEQSGGSCVDIGGATASTLLLAVGNVGHAIRVVVSATNSGGSSSATSAATEPVQQAVPPSNTVPPSISGIAQQGQTLTAATGTWSGSQATYSYKWRSCDRDGNNCVDIAGATSATYIVAAATIGLRLTVLVTASNAGGSASASATPTARVASDGSGTEEPLLDPIYEPQLTELLLAQWPNHFSAAEQGLGNAGLALSIRRSLLRARTAAKALPDLGVLPPLQNVQELNWKIVRQFQNLGGSDTRWVHFQSTNLGLGTVDNPTVQEWCGFPPYAEEPIYADPCRRNHIGLDGRHEAWIIGYHDDSGTQGTDSIINCAQYPSYCGEPPANPFRDSIYPAYNVSNTAGSLSFIENRPDDPQKIQMRFILTDEIWRRLKPDAFEVFGSQPVSLATGAWTVPSPLNLDAARAVLQLDDLVHARNWINSELDPEWQPPSGDVTLDLLQRFAPEVRYDSQEAWFADAANEITDNYAIGDVPPRASNKLLGGAEEVIAVADPLDPAPDLTLGYLGQLYPGGLVASDADHIDEINDYENDEKRMHADPLYENRMYGRVIQNGTSKILQYWFFYYYNGFRPAGIGDHEGDWEMMQIGLDDNESPVQVIGAHHTSAERCEWLHVQRRTDGRPIVYSAVGAHATYFSSGSHLWQSGAVADNADGLGERVVPLVIDVSASKPWLQWPGKWGGSGGSPDGPAFHGQWDDPVGWAGAADGCTEEQTYPFRRGNGARPSTANGAKGLVAPPMPKLHARRAGAAVVVDYRFSGPSTAKRPWRILASLDGLADNLSVQTRSYLARGSGSIRLKTGRARAPYRVLVSVFSAEGARTAVKRIAVR